MKFCSSLRIIGEDIFYMGVKVASITEEKGHLTVVEKFKRMIEQEAVKETEYVTYCTNCEEYLDEE